ncbi:amine sulfotransferase-like [Pecten maximus]|uniref:amine sulfotransferase-like n=1 Tax=Pecten maximus TaxID=6579 RepID=UPI0014588B39|nr:amine sulfotransferase-like [Pecten maximus]
MEVVTIVDEENNKYAFKRYNGHPFPLENIGNVRDQLEKIANHNIKEDDVLVMELVTVVDEENNKYAFKRYNGYPFTTDFIGNVRDQLDKIAQRNIKEDDVLDFNDIEEMQSPRTFGSHLRFRFLPEQMKLGKGKIVTITRNPKDIVVSLYHMLQKLTKFVGYEGTFDGFLKYFLGEERKILTETCGGL